MIEHMFESGELRSTDIAGLVCQLARLGKRRHDAAELIDQIRRLEELKSAAAAAQARVTTLFAAAQRTVQRAAGVPAGSVGKGIGAQVALARRDSPPGVHSTSGWPRR